MNIFLSVNVDDARKETVRKSGNQYYVFHIAKHVNLNLNLDRVYGIACVWKRVNKDNS